jgi:hypothetical protein
LVVNVRLHLWNFLALTAIALLPTAPGFAASYRATLLHPIGATDSAAISVFGSHQVGYAGVSQGQHQAYLWQNSAESFVNLHPPGYAFTEANDIDGGLQVGWGSGPETQFEAAHALLWNGNADSVVDLHPAGEYRNSGALAVSGTTQVGFVRQDIFGVGEAILWYGTADSAVYLHPDNFNTSTAFDVWGTYQVGWGGIAGNDHALMWSGSADSVVDLNPIGFTASQAWGVWDSKQIGTGRNSLPMSYEHALLWNGSAESYIDLHPDGFVSSQGRSIAGEFQAGSGSVATPDGNQDHAILWNGSAESAIDLHQYLSPLGFDFNQSYAARVSEDGTVVGYAYTLDSVPHSFAVMWTPIPEPSAILLVLSCLPLIVPRSLSKPR